MDYAAMLSPLVTVSGIRSDALPPYALSQPPDKLVISTKNVDDAPLIRSFAEALTGLSLPPGPWDPRTSREDRVNFIFTNSISVPTRSKKPSLLSPRHAECRHPIFTVQWLHKYLFCLPAVSIVVVNVPRTDREIEEFLTVLLTLRDTIAQYGVHLTVIVLGKDSELARVVPILRKQSGLSPKNGLLAMADDLNAEELNEFVGAVYDAALTKSRDFFAQKIAALREKRRAVSPAHDLLAWDARYTLKMAYCSEFKGDLAGALKLYESSYDSLAVMFENSAITTKSPAYGNAREVLDAVALKILQRSLPSHMAFEKFLVHISTVEQAWLANDIDSDCKNALTWKGLQFAQFAKLCTTLKHAGVTSATLSQNPSGTPTGLIWLNAAKLLATEPNHEANEDPFALDPRSVTDEPLDRLPQDAFINAISDLSGLRRTRAYALMQYGDWLAKTDANAALEAFKSARQTLTADAWPDLQLYLSERLGDKFMLFNLGTSDEFVAPSKDELQSLPPLFDCTATFEAPSTHVGQEIRAQVTLTPKFSGAMALKTLRIHHTLGSVVFEDKEQSQNEQRYLVVASDTQNLIDGCLMFNKRGARTFQFSVTSVNTGEIKLKSVELSDDAGFSQTIDIEGASEAWLLTDEEPHARNKRHLPVLSTPTVALVNTRPAKLEVLDNTPATGALGEALLFSFEIRSREAEDVVPKISVTLDSRDLDTPSESLLELTETLKSKGPYVEITGRCNVPSAMFELVITAVFETSTDKLPVVYEYRKEVEVVKPFRVSYDLVPEFHQQAWPAFFAPTLDLPQLTRTWRLSSTILSLFSNADVILRSSKIAVECDNATFQIDEPEIDLQEHMAHNSIKHISHRFASCLKPESSPPSIKTLEAVANAELTWARKTDPEVSNVFKLPPIRLNLPTQEPRVLVVADKRGNSAELSQVSYHIENPSPRLLNFSISMSSSIYHAFQGPKQVSIRMLPFSTRSLTYQLVPLGDGAVQNKRPLPDLRVYDVNYKRTLSILPGDENITFHQGTLFL